MASRATRRQRLRALAKAKRFQREAVEALEQQPESHLLRTRAEAFTATVVLMEQAIREDP